MAKVLYAGHTIEGKLGDVKTTPEGLHLELRLPAFVKGGLVVTRAEAQELVTKLLASLGGP